MQYVLSRFVMLRPADGGWLVDGPLMTRTFLIRSPSVLQLLWCFQKPQRLEALYVGRAPKEIEILQKFVEVAEKAGALAPVKEDGAAGEEPRGLLTWEFHDLLFHACSRLGTNRTRLGATFRFGRDACPEPAVAAPRNGHALMALREPAEEPAMPLWDALVTRRTRYDCGALDLQTLSTFLYRTCRVVDMQAGDETLLRKVYPSGGSRHSLEVYPLVFRCAELAQGLYHYDARAHGLRLLRPFDDRVGELLLDATRSAGGMQSNPSVLFVISARFARTAWKYESISYRLTMIELGALFQTMYLVATAMNLAPCALGSGDSKRFSELIGLDYWTETSVGEFMMSRRL